MLWMKKHRKSSKPISHSTEAFWKRILRSPAEVGGLHEAAFRVDTVTLTGDKLFKMNISNAGTLVATTTTALRTSSVTSTPSPFVTPRLLEEASRKQKGLEWIQDRNKE